MAVEGRLEVRGKRRGVILITYRAAAILMIGVLLAFLVGFWKLQQIQHDYVHRIAVSQCEVGNDSRGSDLSAWEDLRALVKTTDPRADAFIAKIRKKDQQRVLIGDKCSLPPSSPQPTSPTTTGAP